MSVEELRKITLLEKIDSDLLHRLELEKSLFFNRHRKGATIHNQNEEFKWMDLVVSGTLAAYSLSENGSAVNMFEFRRGSMIGANLLFGQQQTYPLNIYSVTDCVLVSIRKKAVLELLHDYDFVLQFVAALSLNAQGMNRRIVILTQKTLRENLLEYLNRQCCLQDSRVIELPISKKELADHLGVQRPSLFRAFKRLKEEGVLSVDNRKVKLH